jgi:hypothetical protein
VPSTSLNCNALTYRRRPAQAYLTPLLSAVGRAFLRRALLPPLGHRTPVPNDVLDGVSRVLGTATQRRHTVSFRLGKKHRRVVCACGWSSRQGRPLGVVGSPGGSHGFSHPSPSLLYPSLVARSHGQRREAVGRCSPLRLFGRGAVGDCPLNKPFVLVATLSRSVTQPPYPLAHPCALAAFADVDHGG